MLTRLTLERFKSWASAELEFGLVTGLFGTNSSGKSSLIQFLLLLKQTRDATDRRLAFHLGDERTRTRLGRFEDIVLNHDTAQEIAWKLEWRSETPLSLESASATKPIVSTDELSVAAAVTLENDEPRQSRVSYEAAGRRFSLTAGDTDVSLDGTGSFRLQRGRGRPTELGAPTKGYLFPDAARLAYKNAAFLADLEAAYERQMDQIYYLGPLRDPPKREYAWSGAQPGDVGDRGEYAIEAMLAASRREVKLSVPNARRQQPFEVVIGYWLKRLGLIHAFSAKPVARGTNIYRVLVQVRPGSPEVPLTDVGFGVSQILPVVVLLHYVPEGSTVCLEQPEIHLHPLAQAELADLILEVAKSRRTQVLVESHSEHLLLRLQRRVAEQTVAADDVRLYFAHPNGASSVLDKLELDELGNIHNWPDKFMGDAFTETSKAEMARLNRQLAAE